MANTYHKIYLQFVFAVKFRQAVIDPKWNKDFFAVIGNLINENDCKTLIVNGVEDHVHCLVGMKPALAVSDLMKSVKAKASKHINENNLTKKHFEWQDGYGVFSYGQSQIDAVYRYIVQQEKHHKKKTFLEEYREMLAAFKIDYDEEYIFKPLI